MQYALGQAQQNIASQNVATLVLTDFVEKSPKVEHAYAYLARVAGTLDIKEPICGTLLVGSLQADIFKKPPSPSKYVYIVLCSVASAREDTVSQMSPGYRVLCMQ